MEAAALRLGECSEDSKGLLRHRQLQVSTALLTATNEDDLWQVCDVDGKSNSFLAFDLIPRSLASVIIFYLLTTRMQIFELDCPRTNSVEVRRRFNSLARLVHPDKSGMADTGPAFTVLQEAARTLSRRAGSSSASAEPPSPAMSSSSGSGTCWWDRWDEPSPRPRTEQQESPEEAAADLTSLEQRDASWLRQEVARRQDALFDNNGSAGLPLPVLNKRLQRAKEVLRRKQAQADKKKAGGGMAGFLQRAWDDPSGFAYGL